MKITSVYIELDCDRFDPKIRSQYQFVSNYLTLFISEWVKSLKLDLGSFNRIIFEEGNKDDLSVAGDRAFVVCLTEEFKGFEYLGNAKEVHKYFVSKYLEGFDRFDKEFELNLSNQIRTHITRKFNNCFEYEKKAKSKKIGDLTVHTFHRYKYDRYEFIVRVLNKNKDIVKDVVIFECEPDPFVVVYKVNKIEIDESYVKLIDTFGEEIVAHMLWGQNK